MLKKKKKEQNTKTTTTTKSRPFVQKAVENVFSILPRSLCLPVMVKNFLILVSLGPCTCGGSADPHRCPDSAHLCVGCVCLALPTPRLGLPGHEHLTSSTDFTHKTQIQE